MKKRRANKAKRAVAQPKFRARVEQPVKGPGAYQRKTKHTTKPDEQN
jgi:stalled ribosome alternative rescue factor ArfA